MILQKKEQQKRFSHTHEVCHLLAPLYAVFIPIISFLSLKDLCVLWASLENSRDLRDLKTPMTFVISYELNCYYRHRSIHSCLKHFRVYEDLYLRMWASYLVVGSTVNPFHDHDDSSRPRCVDELGMLARLPSTVCPKALPQHFEQLVRAMLQSDVDLCELSEGNNNKTVLHLAVERNHAKMVSLLLESGQDIIEKSVMSLGHKMRPLHVAAYFDHAEVMQVLLDAGADFNAFATTYNGNSVSPLYFAAKHDRSRCVPLLLSVGANVNGDGSTVASVGTPLDRALYWTKITASPKCSTVAPWVDLKSPTTTSAAKGWELLVKPIRRSWRALFGSKLAVPTLDADDHSSSELSEVISMYVTKEELSARSSRGDGASSRHLEEGMEVEGNYHGRGKWYPGRISRDHANGFFDIEYDDGDKELYVYRNFLRLLDAPSSSPCAPLTLHLLYAAGGITSFLYRHATSKLGGDVVVLSDALVPTS